MTTFYTADHHAYGDTILRHQKRPYASQEEMIEAVVEQWNSQVKPGDLVKHLGDFSQGTFSETANLLDRLNGTFDLILGNKDNLVTVKELARDGYIRNLSLTGEMLFFEKDLTVLVTHYPTDINISTEFFNIHAHIHSKPSILPSQINVSINSLILQYKPDFYLPSEEEIRYFIEERKLAVEHYFSKESKQHLAK